MHPHAGVITRFYDSFQALDGDAMAGCYHKDAVFRDPVFPELRGNDIGDMWRMLASSARGFRLTYRDVTAEEDQGSAHWEAAYLFSKTGRPVHNVIEARFRFKDGLIVEHTDSFDFWRWTRQALGPTGALLGWSPLVRNKVRAQAAARLASFQGRRP